MPGAPRVGVLVANLFYETRNPRGQNPRGRVRPAWPIPSRSGASAREHRFASTTGAAFTADPVPAARAAPTPATRLRGALSVEVALVHRDRNTEATRPGHIHRTSTPG